VALLPGLLFLVYGLLIPASTTPAEPGIPSC